MEMRLAIACSVTVCLFAAFRAAAGEPVAYPDHANLLVVRDKDGHERPVETPADWAVRRQHLLDNMQLVMGPLPDESRRVPLDVKVISEEKTDKYIRRKISYLAEPDDRVPAWLLLPNSVPEALKSADGKGPAMLCLHQTTTIGKDEPAGLGGLDNLHYAHELAERGYVCLVPDYPSFGEYQYDFKAKGKDYASGSMKAIWNNIRGVDLLVSLKEVDPERIGVIGHSLGGHNALFTATFDTAAESRGVELRLHAVPRLLRRQARRLDQRPLHAAHPRSLRERPGESAV